MRVLMGTLKSALSLLAVTVTLFSADPAGDPQSRYWAFQPVQRPEVPAVRNPSWIRNPIDAFILARLEKEGIQPAAEADRNTLIRRLSLDLTGLPPSAADVQAFVSDSKPGAYERVVDRLLSSPHYGERWARYWLDLARYADSDGFRNDRFRPHAWRYRQWLIEAINADMPFDQFTIEQIAGDLLPKATVAQRVATGFHRNTLTNREGGTDPEQFRFEQVVDRTNTLGTVWLGLTVGCAQCHDHKYDPISQRDYYRMFAFFNNAEEVNIEAPLPGELGPYLQAKPAYDQRRKQLLDQAGVPALQAEWERRMLEAAANPGKWLDWDHAFDDLRTNLDWGENLLRTDPAKRSASEKKLLTDYFVSNYQRVIDRARREELRFNELRKKLSALDATLPAFSEAPVLGPERTPRKTHIQLRGDYRSKGIEVQPGFPGVLPAPPSDAELTRLDLAHWLLAPDNPLTSRVAVNRIWQELFGRGLVRTSENFGTQGEKPSHPELLDWLAAELMEGRWRVKRMHRMIVLSAAYRQSSNTRSELLSRDPGNALVARQNRFRLNGEFIRDGALAVSGLLNPAIGGRSIRPSQPEGVASFSNTEKNSWTVSGGQDRYRRGMYIQLHRTEPYPQLLSFDVPNGYGAVCRRTRSNTPLQALNLLNDPNFTEAAQALASRLVARPGIPDSERLEQAFLVCLARSPAPEERQELLRYLQLQCSHLERNEAAVNALYPAEVPRGVSQVEAAAWVALSSVLLNTDEFLTRE